MVFVSGEDDSGAEYKICSMLRNRVGRQLDVSGMEQRTSCL